MKPPKESRLVLTGPPYPPPPRVDRSNTIASLIAGIILAIVLVAACYAVNWVTQ